MRDVAVSTNRLEAGRLRQAPPSGGPRVVTGSTRSALRIIFDERVLTPPLIDFFSDATIGVVPANPERDGFALRRRPSCCLAFGRFSIRVPLFVIMANARQPSPAKSSTARKSAEANTAPAFRKQFGRIAVAAWPKMVTGPDGRRRDTFVSTVSVPYRDGDTLKRTHYLFPEDLLPAAHALIKQWEQLAARDFPTEEQDR